jgi:hypothetical protein
LSLAFTATSWSTGLHGGVDARGGGRAVVGELIGRGDGRRREQQREEDRGDAHARIVHRPGAARVNAR